VPESVKLPLAKKAIWLYKPVVRHCKDLTGSEQFKQTIVELLRGPQTQARLRCSLY